MRVTRAIRAPGRQWHNDQVALIRSLPATAACVALSLAAGPVAHQVNRRTSAANVPPVIDSWQYPASSSNLERVRVSVRIQAPSGIGSAILHYAYGNEVGFRDERPEVSGDSYTFHIEAPGVAFIGEARFAVEAFDRSPRATRAMSAWRGILLAARDEGRERGGIVRLTNVGVELSQVAAGSAARAELTRWLPAGLAAPKANLVSTGRYWHVHTDADGAGISVRYASEDAWRLIESTLSLAYWDGRDWVRTASRLDVANRRVTAALVKPGYWTLVGEDRVLWRADGRETGPALDDVDGDGKLEVVTVLYQPGELLSSQGKPLARFGMDAPYRPVKNSSSPAVARLAPGAAPMLLFGAPSGYVYAFRPDGTRLWRTQVGGEVLGGPSVGRLLAGGRPGIAAAWEGGVSVIAPDGALVWQQHLPVPSRTYAVVADLDGDGEDEVVVNAADQIVALRGTTGEILWRYRAPGRQLTVPAAGEFARGGKPRLVFGDEQGSVYAIDERGRLAWRQDRIYGPREVPDPVEHYQAVAETALADLEASGERQVIVSTRSGETVSLSARGERLWRFSSYERKVGISYGGGAHLGFADLDQDGRLDVVLSQQDSYIYILGAGGALKWMFLARFWYHSPPAIADLEGSGELNILFSSPEEGGMWALRGGVRGASGRAPWPMARGNLGRTNCAPWQ
jgi:outer membrane protein assembly factor BamB